MSQIKCVIFDFGDTLAQNSKAGFQVRKNPAEIAILKKHGFEFSKKEILEAWIRMREKTKDIPAAIRMKDKYIYAKTLLVELGLKPNLKLAKECEKSYYNALEEKIKPMPNALKLLKYLTKKKIIICVVSNTRIGFNRKAAIKLGMKKYIKHFIMSHLFGSVKSDLKIFRHALEKVNKKRKNRIKPKECLMIGNNVEEDGAAKMIGMKTAILKPTIMQEHLLKKIKPDYLIKDLKEVEKIVKEVD
ncbi:MAG: HAD family hydrolase [Candidatus Diapherotrites archaeon]|nr:HAD family hydrolase [Candidatus Diapherotrites archaeon]